MEQTMKEKQKNKQKQKNLKKIFIPILISVLVYFLVLILENLPFAKKLESVLLNFKFQAKNHIKATKEIKPGVLIPGEKVDSEIMIIGIDEESQNENNLGVWPWDRQVFADFLEYFRIPSQMTEISDEYIQEQLELYLPEYLYFYELDYGVPETEDEKKHFEEYKKSAIEEIKQIAKDSFQPKEIEGESPFAKLDENIQPETIFLDVFFDFGRKTKNDIEVMTEKFASNLTNEDICIKKAILEKFKSSLKEYETLSDNRFFNELKLQIDEQKKIAKNIEKRIQEIKANRTKTPKEKEIDQLDARIHNLTETLSKTKQELNQTEILLEKETDEKQKEIYDQKHTDLSNQIDRLNSALEYTKAIRQRKDDEIAILNEIKLRKEKSPYINMDFLAVRGKSERWSEEVSENRWQYIEPYAIKNIVGKEKLIRSGKIDNLLWHDLKFPLPEIMQNSNTACVMASLEADGQIRKMPLVFAFNDERFMGDEIVFLPTIDLLVALNYLNADINDVKVVFGDGIYIRNAKIPIKRQVEVDYTGAEAPAFITVGYEEYSDMKIPIDDLGKMLINFQGPNRSFDYSSFYEIAMKTDPNRHQRINWAKYRNRVLMVGVSSVAGLTEGSKDYFQTPYGNMFGIEIHANALYTIFSQKFIQNIDVAWIEIIKIAIVILFGIVLARLSILKCSIITTFLISVFIASALLFFDFFHLNINMLGIIFTIIFGFIGITVYKVLTEEREKGEIRNMFGNYVNPTVVHEIINDPEKLKLGGEDTNLTIFFSDIRGFTTLSEKLTPQELVELLNNYLSEMTDIVLSTDGTLDKYIGDAIMAFWGAPIKYENHAYKACAASLDMIDKLEELNSKLPEDKRIAIGIGLNTGIVTVGNMGSKSRKNYTLMGDGVNLASRLEGINKFYHTQIIVSEYTYNEVKEQFIFRELDYIRVKGKKAPVRVFELICSRWL